MPFMMFVSNGSPCEKELLKSIFYTEGLLIMEIKSLKIILKCELQLKCITALF